MTKLEIVYSKSNNQGKIQMDQIKSIIVRYAHLSVLIAILSLAAGGCDNKEKKEEHVFPADFYWGTATAGFQVEMGCPTVDASECMDTGSDWYVWVTDPDIIGDPGTYVAGDPLSGGPGHYELYEHDFDLAKEELSNNAYRMSFEWSRLFPEPTDGLSTEEEIAAAADPVAVQHYHDVLDALRARSITPMVTIHHYTLPSWIHDAHGCYLDVANCSPAGWLDRERTLAEFAKYAAFSAREFGGKVDLWATLNEPYAVVLSGFLMPSADRTNPPGVNMEFEGAKTAVQSMIEAHALAYDTIHQNDDQDADGDGQTARVGVVYNIVATAPMNPSSELDQEAAENVDYLYNRVFLNAVTRGELDANMDGSFEYREDLDGRMDYIGVNYYTRITVEGVEWPVFPELSPLSNFDPFSMRMWEDYPRGLYEVLVSADEYGYPLIVTECGTPNVSDDEAGPDFLVRHLIWLSRAVREGINVEGFFYWSLTDNYEWNHGMGMKFGLFAVDPEDPTKERTLRKTGEVYGRIARENRIPEDLADFYHEPMTP